MNQKSFEGESFVEINSEETRPKEIAHNKIELGEEITLHQVIFDSGITSFQLEKSGSVYDLQSLLPQDWKFVDKKYRDQLIEEKEEDIPDGKWACDYKRHLVWVETASNPEDLLALFHEIGHTEDSERNPKLYEEMIEITEAQRLPPGEKIVYATPELRELHRRLEKQEFIIKRVAELNAWINAVQNLERLGILRNLFSSADELFAFVRKSLATYRERFSVTTSSDPETRELVGNAFDKDPALKERLARFFKDDSEDKIPKSATL